MHFPLWLAVHVLRLTGTVLVLMAFVLPAIEAGATRSFFWMAAIAAFSAVPAIGAFVVAGRLRRYQIDGVYAGFAVVGLLIAHGLMVTLAAAAYALVMQQVACVVIMFIFAPLVLTAYVKLLMLLNESIPAIHVGPEGEGSGRGRGFEVIAPDGGR